MGLVLKFVIVSTRIGAYVSFFGVLIAVNNPVFVLDLDESGTIFLNAPIMVESAGLFLDGIMVSCYPMEMTSLVAPLL